MTRWSSAAWVSATAGLHRRMSLRAGDAPRQMQDGRESRQHWFYRRLVFGGRRLDVIHNKAYS